MFKGYIRRGFVTLGIVLLSLACFLGLLGQNARAIGEEIRVALFVENQNGGYRQTVPIVSINSDTGMSIAGPSGEFGSIGGAQFARFMLDQYYLIATETKQLSEARHISQLLAQQGFVNVIVEYTSAAEPLYRVITGSEASLQAIQQVQRDLQAKANQSSRVAGPYRVQAGSFASLGEANQRLAEIQVKGYTGAVAFLNTTDGLDYQVWIGDEVSAQAQADLQAALAHVFPHMNFQAASAKEYILSTSTSMSLGEQVPLYLISTEQRITISPRSAGIVPLLEVEEKENRSYRGKLELSRYLDRLAVVNILPLEEYLYSVVGTEMATGWPLEALKAQAVMSRNFAYLHLQGQKYGLAHVSDSVFEQAYYGYAREADDVRQAVEATRGEYLTYQGEVFSTFYHSNAGGMTAEGFEVWGNQVETHVSVPSHDRYPETVQATWYRVQDSQGQIGYVIDQYVQKTNKYSALGFPIGVVNISSLNYRSGPATDQPLIGSLKEGDRLIIFEEVKQNNAYSWIAGPFTGTEMMNMVNQRADAAKTSPRLNQPLRTLTVTERGPSGRVLRLEGDGQVLHHGSPDGLRSLFNQGNGSLRSTKFEVEAVGEFTVLGAGGKVSQHPQSSTGRVQLLVLGAGRERGTEVNGTQDQFAIYNQEGKLRIAHKEPAFRLHGYGYGHGLGASQWGIRALALEGYSYQQILQHYFHQNSVLERR